MVAQYQWSVMRICAPPTPPTCTGAGVLVSAMPATVVTVTAQCVCYWGPFKNLPVRRMGCSVGPSQMSWGKVNVSSISSCVGMADRLGVSGGGTIP